MTVRPLRWIGLGLIVLGIGLVAIGLATGQGTLSLFLVFPVVTATGIWSALGIVFIVAGFIAGFFGLSTPDGLPSPAATQPTDSTAREPASAETSAPRRWGGVIFLGPIPIVFGSSPKVARWMLVVGVLLFVGLVLLTLFAFWRL
jgi:uncharacterized protein (TIGR00304 family)